MTCISVSYTHLYYGRLRRMLELDGFDVVGHADTMHYNAACYRPGLLDEVWDDTLVKEYFEDIAARGYQVEINTKSYHDSVSYTHLDVYKRQGVVNTGTAAKPSYETKTITYNANETRCV